MTAPTTPADMAIVSRALDACVMAFATADLHSRPVQLDDIVRAVDGQYVTHLFDYIRTRLDRGPCSDDCPVVDAVWLTGTVYGQALYQHVAIEISLLTKIQALTGETPAEVLSGLREEAERSEA